MLKKRAHIGLVVMLVCYATILTGQSSREADLRSSISSLAESPALVDSMIALSKVLQNSARAESINLVERALPMAKRIDYQAGYTTALGRLGLQYYNIGKYDSAAVLTNEYIVQLKPEGDSTQLANALSLSGVIQANLGNADVGFKMLIRALGISLRNDLHLTAIYSYNRMAGLMVTKDLPASIDYLDAAYEIANAQNLHNLAAKLAVNLSVFHDSLDVKLEYLDKALASAKKLNLIDVQAGALVSKSRVYEAQENYQAAIDAYLNSIDLYHSIDDQNKVEEVKYFLAQMYIKNKDFKEAEKNLNASIKSEVYSEDKWMHQSVLHHFGQAYAGQNKYRQAYDSLEKSYLLALDFYHENLADRLQELNKKYDNAEKEKEIARQELEIAEEKSKRARQLLMGLGILSLLVLSGIYLFMQQKKRRRETQHALALQEVEAASLKDLNRMKSRWFENISHDIRTPLTLISAPIRDVLNTTKSASTIHLLQIAERNSEHLLQLTNEMLELARLENSIIPLRPTTINARLEIQKTIHAFDSFATQRKVTIESTLNLEDTLYLNIDFDKYEKIFNNLFKNAIQYSSSETTVKVNIRFDANMLTTEIIDQGPGIPDDEIPLLFDKYFRASHQQSKLVEGSGLGLSIAKELVDLMDGHIEVKNNVDRGCTFMFSVKAAAAEQQLVSEQLQEEDVQTFTHASLADMALASLLIVEDNPEMLQYLATVLRAEYTVHTAENPVIALQKLADTAVDLILSDIMMPGMDGFTFKKRVNALAAHRDIPFIFLSAKALDEDKLEGLRLGVDDYITKPFITNEVKVRIRNILTRQSIRKESLKESLIEDSNTEQIVSEENTSIAQRAAILINNNIENSNFGVDQLASDLHYSSRQLNRKLKQETGMTTVQFILELRLQQARKLLLSNEFYSTKEVQHRVGIQSQSYFSRKYTERFGSPPGAVLG